jgi:hypothetical protein
MTTQTETRAIADVIRAAGVTMTATQADDNPNMDSASRGNMDHWRCTFRVRGQNGSWTTPFSMGVGLHGRAPTVADVLGCVMDDASGADELFESWCGEYGYDTDSRKAERTYRIVRRQTACAKRFFGASLFAELFNAERL